jgi:hypothetical protein
MAFSFANGWFVDAGSTEEACPHHTAPAAEVAAEPSYSPFVVDVDSASHDAVPFHLISFKDVGMSLPDDATRQVAYESLAEALSLELADLSGDPGAPTSSSVRHDHGLTHPSAHLACEGGHIYVDVWRSGEGGPYGYSLWSGCGEDDRFAYNERVVASSDDAAASMDSAGSRDRRVPRGRTAPPLLPAHLLKRLAGPSPAPRTQLSPAGNGTREEPRDILRHGFFPLGLVLAGVSGDPRVGLARPRQRLL